MYLSSLDLLFRTSFPALLLIGSFAQGILPNPIGEANLTVDTRQTWCTASDEWVQPYWPPHVHMECERILHYLETSQKEVHGYRMIFQIVFILIFVLTTVAVPGFFTNSCL